MANIDNPALIIMAKEPDVGTTKTRLSPPLSPKEAAQLYEALLRDTLAMASELDGVHLAVAVTPPTAMQYFREITPRATSLVPVRCDDIGDCLRQVMKHLLEQGYPKVMALNSDGPSLPREHLQRAASMLDENDVVLGPCEDGGYYLIGLKHPHPELFTGIDWSTSRVFSQTLAKVKALGLESGCLPVWYDVDTADDLRRLQDDLDTLPPQTLNHTRKFLRQWAGIS